MSPFTLADDLLLMDAATSVPRELPGRYGRVVRDLERLLAATETLAVVAGGWAVWHHGYAGRVTQDVDIVVPSDRIEVLQQAGKLIGFEVLQSPPGRWPKIVHTETNIDVDLLPQWGIPGTPTRPAPIPIRHPLDYAANQQTLQSGTLQYSSLAGLVELRLGASRAKDIADLVELIKSNPQSSEELTALLHDIHPSYAERFQELIQQAAEE